MRFGDALCAAMHEGKWITTVVQQRPRDTRAGFTTVRERVAFRYCQESGLWQAAVWYPPGPWRHWQNGVEVIPCRMSTEAIASEWEIVEVGQ